MKYLILDLTANPPEPITGSDGEIDAFLTILFPSIELADKYILKHLVSLPEKKPFFPVIAVPDGEPYFDYHNLEDLK
jgi:hypothetical protein